MKKSSSITEQERLSPKELAKEIFADKAEAARIRLAIEMGSEKNHAKYRDLRRKIARMSTILSRLPVQKDTPENASQVKEKSVQRTSSRSSKK